MVRRTRTGPKTTTRRSRGTTVVQKPLKRGNAGQFAKGTGKGTSGRQKGTKDAIPKGRSVKASIKAIIDRVVNEEGTTIRKALVDGIKGGPRFSHNYLRLAAEYTDGKPVDTLNLNATWNEDELTQAQARLDKKMAALTAAVLAKKKSEPEPSNE